MPKTKMYLFIKPQLLLHYYVDRAATVVEMLLAPDLTSSMTFATFASCTCPFSR